MHFEGKGTGFWEAMSVTFSHSFINDQPLYDSFRQLQAVCSDLRRAYQSAAARKVHVTAETQVSRRGSLTPWIAQETDGHCGLICDWERVELSLESSEKMVF